MRMAVKVEPQKKYTQAKDSTMEAVEAAFFAGCADEFAMGDSMLTPAGSAARLSVLTAPSPLPKIKPGNFALFLA